LRVVPDFAKTIAAAYATEGEALDLGRAVHDGAVHRDAAVRVPLATLNRHGLIAGATGTGKTKTLQVMAEQLSAAGVPVFVADVKGDVSGLAAPADPGGPAEKRMADLGLAFEPRAFPVEFLSLGGLGPGVPVRANVSDFGPQLLAKVLGANETQESSLGLVFHYADTKGLPLVDLSDLRALLTFLDSDAGKAELQGIGGLSSQTVGVLLRSLVGLETGGGTEFFGEPQLDVADLMRVAPDGRGIVSCLELAAVQDKPVLWSTALMWLVAELFESLPEAGDLPKPKLVFFLDEAHLLFDDATDAFLESVSRTVRLIRSKGVGVFFVTQQPTDIPDEVLGQLGARVQHALRAFTPADAKDLRATVSTYPRSEFYDLETLLTSMGIGEAAVTLLSESGVPTPVAHTRLVAPASRMAPADDVDGTARSSPLWAEYGARTDPQSARELLAGRLATAGGEAEEAGPGGPPGEPGTEPPDEAPPELDHIPIPESMRGPQRRSRRRRRAPAPRTSTPDAIGDFLGSRQGKTLQREIVRGVFGLLRKRL
jgi:DNA helicase HerA-like ATPase